MAKIYSKVFVSYFLGFGLLLPFISSASTHEVNPDSGFYKSPTVKRKAMQMANCYDINWTVWNSFSDVNTATGSVIDADGSNIDITMSANYTFSSTPSIYTYSRFSGYPSTIPNSTVPKTTWAAGAGGTTTICFSKKAVNPVLLLSSLGSSLPQSARLNFSLPYVVLYDGGGMVYNSSTALTGTEGYAIIMFPGEFNCVTVNSTTPENYTNLTWGIRPQPFNVLVEDVSATCGSTSVKASGGVTYKWSGGDTPDQATNVFHQSGTYIVTVTNGSGCVTSSSKEVIVSNTITPAIKTFNVAQQVLPTFIDDSKHTILITVAKGTNLKNLSPQITITPGAIIDPESGTLQDFTTPINYTLTTECSTVTYKVTIILDNTVPVVITTCSGQFTLLKGTTPIGNVDGFQWQQNVNNMWMAAPGSASDNDYQTPVLNNYSGAEMLEGFRRIVKYANGNIGYDSYYDVSTKPSTSQNNLIADKVEACANEATPVNIAGNTPAGYFKGVTYRWEQSVDGNRWKVVDNATGQSFEFTPVATTYVRRVTVANDCEALSNVITITYYPHVTIANAGEPQTKCGVSTVKLNANTPQSGEQGEWSVVSPLSYNPFNSTNTNDPLATITNLPEDVDVVLKWTIKQKHCQESLDDNVTVRNNSIPIVNAGSNIYINYGESAMLHGDIQQAHDYTFYWSPSAGLSNVNSLSIVAKPQVTTTYSLNVFSAAGCNSIATVTVYVNNELGIPNTITPNGDGVNDEWRIENIYSYKKVTVQIFDRWGSQVFSSTGYSKPWDGTRNGKKLPAGVYYYLIEMFDNKTKRAGPITLIY